MKMVNLKEMPKLLTTIGNKTKSVATSISLTNHQQLPPPPPPPIINDKKQQQALLSNNDNKPIITTTPSIICTKSIATTSNAVNAASSSQLSSSTKNICCTTCSSNDITEINIKIKSCQNCNQINIDELSYSYNKKMKSSSLSSTTTTNTVQACYHQLANITRKLKSIYKNRINQTTTEILTTTPLSSQNSSLIAIDENNLILSSSPTPTTETGSKDLSNKHNYCQQHQNFVSTKINQNTLSTSLNDDKKLRDDVLVLRICDLDHKKNKSNNTTTTKNNYTTITANKSCNNYQQNQNLIRDCKENDIQNNINNKKYRSPIVNKNNNSTISAISNASNTCSNSNTISTSPNIKIIGKNKIIRSSQQYQQKFNNKSSRKILKSLSVDQQSPNTATSSINNNKSTRKIVVITDEYKKKSENITDIQINCSLDRKEIMKKFRQNNEISKSLDIILPTTDLLNDFNENLNDNFNSIINPPPYICTSKSTSNLNDENNINDDDDDDGPFESINSVELIFISDEFLNKAIKHDLKILKNNNKRPNINYFHSLDNQTNDIKLNKPKIKLDSCTTTAKINDDENCNINTSRKNSISPSLSTSIDKNTTSPKSSSATPSGGGGRGSNNSQKKLIIISEDFKRKSLENNIVIVNDNNINQKYTKLTTTAATKSSIDNDKNITIVNCVTGDDITAAEQIAIKRKTIKDLKLTRQQSSIDDVGNQMLSHAFCSAEEPDEQCLESKEIITTPE